MIRFKQLFVVMSILFLASLLIMYGGKDDDYYIDLNQNAAQHISHQGGTLNITVSSDIDWNFNTDQDLITVERNSDKLKLTIPSNPSNESRVGNLKVFSSDSELSKTLVIVQEEIESLPIRDPSGSECLTILKLEDTGETLRVKNN